jgi:hypothetical protein
VATGYLVTQPDGVTINMPPDLGVVATPGSEIVAQYDAGDGLPGPAPPHGGHVSSPFQIWTSLVQVCNVLVRNEGAPPGEAKLVISGAYGCGKKKGVYRWSVAAGRLTLTKLQDSCAYSVAVYAGVWKREKT